MNKKIIGIILIIVAIASSAILYSLKAKLEKAFNYQIQQYGASCPTDPKICPHSQMANLDSFSYVLFSLFGILTLFGMYLIFDKSDRKIQENQLAITKTLENIKKKEMTDDKFNILLKAFDDDEKNILNIIKEQDGISQNTLTIKSNLSKSKVSAILSDFDKKELIKKVRKGKINLVYLKKAL